MTLPLHSTGGRAGCSYGATEASASFYSHRKPITLPDPPSGLDLRVSGLGIAPLAQTGGTL